MKNSGLSRLVLSEPQTKNFKRARVLAVDAQDLLESVLIVPSLRDAVAHGTLVAGTTSRKPKKRPTLWLSEWIDYASQETDSGGEVVMVFGNEQRGLSDAELDFCQLVVNIPVSPAKESINLAQAVMIAAHQCFLASWSSGKKEESRLPLAPVGTQHTLFDFIRQVLLEVDFLNTQNPDTVLSEIKRLIERARPTQREAELLLTAFRHISRAIKPTK